MDLNALLSTMLSEESIENVGMKADASSEEVRGVLGSALPLLLNGAMAVQGVTLSSMRSAYDNGKKSAGELETAINRQRQTQVTASVIETSSGLRPMEEG